MELFRRSQRVVRARLPPRPGKLSSLESFNFHQVLNSCLRLLLYQLKKKLQTLYTGDRKKESVKWSVHIVHRARGRCESPSRERQRTWITWCCSGGQQANVTTRQLRTKMWLEPDASASAVRNYATTHRTPWILVALHECRASACRVTLNQHVSHPLISTDTTLSPAPRGTSQGP